MKNAFTLLVLLMIIMLISCNDGKDSLPILGNRDIVDGDTVYHEIPAFTFIDQDSQIINKSTFSDKAYVADFFFTSCPTICPKVKQQMLRIYDRFETQPRLVLLSHSIDTRRDSVPVLKKFANKLEIDSKRWHLVTGVKKEIYDIADDYFSIAIEDEDAPGGFDHSGRLILVDAAGHIRSYCNGTEAESVDAFMDDIQILLDEMDH